MAKWKLLVVDDEKDIVDWVKQLYSGKGFVCFGATEGIAAIEIFIKERPHIVLIDVHMPYSPIDGIETLKRIKAIDTNALCIMVTRIDDKIKVDECRALGALWYLMKPLTLEELDQSIDKALTIVKKRG